MKLQMLSFEGDRILDGKIKETSNYCDNAHIYTATFGITRLIISELSPIDLDGNSKLTIVANVEQQMTGNPGYNCDKFFKVSFFNLDPNKKYRSKVYQCLSQSIGEGIKAEVPLEYFT